MQNEFEEHNELLNVIIQRHALPQLTEAANLKTITTGLTCHYSRLCEQVSDQQKLSHYHSNNIIFKPLKQQSVKGLSDSKEHLT